MSEITEALKRAEKVEVVGDGNDLLCKFQDTTEQLFRNVEVYFPSVIRHLYKSGKITKQRAKSMLKEMFGLRLRAAPSEPDFNSHGRLK